MPPGAVGVSTWAGAAGCSLGISGGCAGARSVGKPLELAEEDSITPAAPIAPRRSISLRFKDIHTLPNEAHCLSFNGLMADNPFADVSHSTAFESRFTAPVVDL